MPNHDALQGKLEKELVELSKAIGDIVQSYKKLRNPLMESQQDVPKTAQHLDKISEQTEAATQQMLDMVEKITQREEEVVGGLQDMKSLISENKTGDVASLIDTLIEKANTNCNDAFTIMDALQFQDITSQQLNHAVSMLEGLESKLSGILKVLHGDQPPQSEGPSIQRKERAFDPHADLFEKKTAQEDIDNLFAGKK